MGEIEIVDVEPVRVMGTRRTGAYTDIPKLFMAIYQHAMANNVTLKGPAMFISHEMSEEEALKAQEEGNADLEVAFPVVGSAPETEEIKCYELPGGTMARMMYKGPYGNMGPTYGKLMAWLEENGKHVTGFFRELYHNDPSQVTEEELLTEILVPVE
ncbi:MAG: GyrI-like domain-containing protein [Thermoplasmatota archaeon]